MSLFKNKEEFEKWLYDHPEREIVIATSAEIIEAFEKALIEDAERIMGHKVRFSKKNRL